MLKMKTKLFSIISKIDSFIEKNEIIYKYLVLFTDKLSRFTHFCLFDIRCLVSVILFLAIFMYYRAPNLDLFFETIDMYGFSFEVLQLAFDKFITIDMKLVMLLYVLFIEAIIFCMLLINLPCINKALKKMYTPNVIKERGYNSASTSLFRAFTVVGTTITSCFGLHTVSKMKATELVAHQNAEEARLAREQGRAANYATYPYHQTQATVQASVDVEVAARLTAAREASSSQNLTGTIFQNPENKND